MKPVLRPRTDALVRAWTPSVRVALTRNTLTAKNAMERHKMPIADALPLGKMMASASLMASILRGEERVIMDMQSDAARYYAEAIAVGEVRGFVRRPQGEGVEVVTAGAKTSPLGVKPPPGTFSVKLVLYERATPIESIVPVTREGDVTEAMRAYFERSEQIGHIVELDAVADAANAEVAWSGGLVVQALPAPEGKSMIAAIEAVSARLQKLLPLHQALGEGSRELEDFLGAQSFCAARAPTHHNRRSRAARPECRAAQEQHK